LGFFINYYGGSESFVLTTTEVQPVSYSMYIPRTGSRYNGKITDNGSIILNLPSNMEVSSWSQTNYGIYLETSSDKVTVIGQNYRSDTSDTYIALPTVKLEAVTQYVYYGSY